MKPTEPTRVQDADDRFSLGGYLHRRGRLMFLLFCLGLASGCAYFTHLRPLYRSTAHLVARAPADVAETGSMRERTRAAIQELQSQHLVERVARRFGIKESARDVHLHHLLETSFQTTGDNEVDISVTATSEELARHWAAAAAEEYADYRVERYQDDKAQILEGFARELKEAAARVGEALDPDLDFANEQEAVEAAVALQQSKGRPAELVRLNKQIDEMGRVRIQLEDADLDEAEKRTLIEKALNSSGGVATGGDGQEYAAVKKRFEEAFQNALNERSEMESERGESLASGDSQAGRQTLAVSAKSRPNWERMIAELQKKIEALEQRWAKESVELSFESISEVRRVPIWPEPPMLLAIAAGIGLLLALVIPGTVEIIHQKRHDVAEVESAMNLRRLGAVPMVRMPMPQPSSEDSIRLSGAFEQIHANLLEAAGDRPSKITLVTSSVAREGKSIVAANLAIAFARNGAATLLIDADFHAGRVHRLFGLRKTPGLAGVLRGDTEVETACRGTSHENVFIISIGEPTRTDADLLSSEKLREMHSKLRERFKHIVIDATAVLGEFEALTFYECVDGIVFVTRRGRTPARTMAAGIERLQARGAHLYGYVLNGAGQYWLSQISSSPAAAASPESTSQPLERA
jgi:capsular exopolysaccharide synthesis family protein